MFSSGPNYTKLKTNLRLALNRLKLLEKKKAELAQKSRKEIADYLATSKIERARIRVEHIIREDYLVEAMEIVEMYCDLLLARFGLVTQMKELDDGIAEAVCSIVWVCPRLQSDVPELKIISEIFAHKYGPQFAESSRTATGNHQVSEKLMHKLQLQAPPKLLVEKYLLAIAKNYNIEYEPDPQVMQEPGKEGEGQDHHLIDLSDRNNLSGGNAPNIGFIGYPAMPELPQMPEPPSSKPFNYPPAGPKGGGGGGGSAASASSGGSKPFAYNIPPGNVPPVTQPPQLPPSVGGDRKDLNTQFINKEQFNDFNASAAGASTSADAAGDNFDANLLRSNMYDDPPPRYSSINPYNMNTKDASKPTPQPRSKFGPPEASAPPPHMDFPALPNVPLDLPDIPNDDDNNRGGGGNNDDEIDFDDLSRRFENLKKKK